MADYSGLANYLIPSEQNLIKASQYVVNDPVLQGLANSVISNPVIQGTKNYLYNKTPIDVTGDLLSVGAVAAAMSNPVSAPIGLARMIGPRTAGGLAQLGKEIMENEIAERAMSNLVNTGFIAEDAKDIYKALKR